MLGFRTPFDLREDLVRVTFSDGSLLSFKLANLRTLAIADVLDKVMNDQRNPFHSLARSELHFCEYMERRMGFDFTHSVPKFENKSSILTELRIQEAVADVVSRWDESERRENKEANPEEYKFRYILLLKPLSDSSFYKKASRKIHLPRVLQLPADFKEMKQKKKLNEKVSAKAIARDLGDYVDPVTGFYCVPTSNGRIPGLLNRPLSTALNQEASLEKQGQPNHVGRMITALDHEQLLVAWINTRLKKGGVRQHISNLHRDLRNGVVLIQLMEVLTGYKVRSFNQSPRTLQQALQNLDLFLRYLSHVGVVIQTRPRQLYAGQMKFVYGAIFMLISKVVDKRVKIKRRSPLSDDISNLQVERSKHFSVPPPQLTKLTTLRISEAVVLGHQSVTFQEDPSTNQTSSSIDGNVSPRKPLPKPRTPRQRGRSRPAPYSPRDSPLPFLEEQTEPLTNSSSPSSSASPPHSPTTSPSTSRPNSPRLLSSPSPSVTPTHSRANSPRIPSATSHSRSLAHHSPAPSPSSSRPTSPRQWPPRTSVGPVTPIIPVVRPSDLGIESGEWSAWARELDLEMEGLVLDVDGGHLPAVSEIPLVEASDESSLASGFGGRSLLAVSEDQSFRRTSPRSPSLSPSLSPSRSPRRRPADHRYTTSLSSSHLSLPRKDELLDLDIDTFISMNVNSDVVERYDSEDIYAMIENLEHSEERRVQQKVEAKFMLQKQKKEDAECMVVLEEFLTSPLDDDDITDLIGERLDFSLLDGAGAVLYSEPESSPFTYASHTTSSVEVSPQSDTSTIPLE